MEKATNYGLLCAAVFPIGVPIYLVISRGWTGALKSFFFVALFMVALAFALVGVYEILGLTTRDV